MIRVFALSLMLSPVLVVCVLVVCLVVASASAQVDGTETETAVREAVEYMCSHSAWMSESDVQNYYVVECGTSTSKLLRLKTPRGERVIELTEEQSQSVTKALIGIASYDNPAQCEAKLVGSILPELSGNDSRESLRKPRSRSFSFSEQNPRCAKNRRFSIPVRASEGWRIVSGSFDTESVRSTAGSSFEGVINVTPTGFTIHGSITNSGNCGRFSRDARGSVWGTVQYKEELENASEVSATPK